MQPAAVGFQCPSCVHEGARATRSGRTAYGGQRSGNPALTSQILIAINAAVWLLVTVTGGNSSRWLDHLALLPDGARFRLSNGTILSVDGVADGAVWQLLTSMFTHVEIMHIGFNMLALWFLGPQLEVAIGRARYLTLYLLSGLMGSAFVFWLAPVNVSTVGASGAIFGLMGALLVIAIKVRADARQLLLWIGLNVVITVFGRGFISWQGHLGGFIGGVLIAMVIVYAPRTNRALWQTVGLSLVGVLALAGVVARYLSLN